MLDKSLSPLQSAAMPAPDMRHQPEARVLWSASEGQVANAGVFMLALLLCWLVLPVLYALYRYLRTAHHVYTLTDQRLLEQSGIIVKHVESVELYRIKDLTVSSTLAQTLFGRGRVVLQSTDTTCPRLLINAVPDAVGLSQLIRDAVEACRTTKGVRAFDY